MLPGPAPRFSRMPGELCRPPLLGEHNASVSGGLRNTTEEVAALRAQNVI